MMNVGRRWASRPFRPVCSFLSASIRDFVWLIYPGVYIASHGMAQDFMFTQCIRCWINRSDNRCNVVLYSIVTPKVYRHAKYSSIPNMAAEYQIRT